MNDSIAKPKKKLREKLLNLCGYEIWPPTHNDPRIKGPQPRIITRAQADAMRRFQASVSSGEPDAAAREKDSLSSHGNFYRRGAKGEIAKAQSVFMSCKLCRVFNQTNFTPSDIDAASLRLSLCLCD